MPKPRGTKTTKNDTESLLAEVLRRVDPGELRLMVPRLAIVRQRASFELTAVTRSSTISWDGKTIAEAAAEAIDYLATPDPDPFQPPWRRCSRMQREVVRNVLLGRAAEHRALAAAAMVAGERTAHRDFALGDAFHAAVAELDHEDIDEEDQLVVDEPLAAGEPTAVRAARSDRAARGLACRSRDARTTDCGSDRKPVPARSR